MPRAVDMTNLGFVPLAKAVILKQPLKEARAEAERVIQEREERKGKAAPVDKFAEPALDAGQVHLFPPEKCFLPQLLITSRNSSDIERMRAANASLWAMVAALKQAAAEAATVEVGPSPLPGRCSFLNALD